MYRKLISAILIIIGLALMAWGILGWFIEGFHLGDIGRYESYIRGYNSALAATSFFAGLAICFATAKLKIGYSISTLVYGTILLFHNPLVFSPPIDDRYPEFLKEYFTFSNLWTDLAFIVLTLLNITLLVIVGLRLYKKQPLLRNSKKKKK